MATKQDMMLEQLNRIEGKVDKLIEVSATNAESIKGQQRQLTGLWTIVLACSAWLGRKALSTLGIL